MKKKIVSVMMTAVVAAATVIQRSRTCICSRHSKDRCL